MAATFITLFQSSSGQKAGCNGASGRRPLPAICFNPHPAFWPDATGDAECGHQVPTPVSILIRPEGRMQQVTSPTCRRLSWFQSSSGQKAGCNSGVVAVLTRSSARFNPHPAFWPDATARDCRWHRVHLRCFNPHPAFWPDATTGITIIQSSFFCFNPHPAFWPDATCSLTGRGGGLAGFNPHPAFWPDATIRRSLPIVLVDTPFQSSSGQKAGCNRFSPSTLALLTRFNPHPAFWPDATAGRCSSPAGSSQGVSILIRPEGRMQLPSSTG